MSYLSLKRSIHFKILNLKKKKNYHILQKTFECEQKQFDITLTQNLQKEKKKKYVYIYIYLC